MLNFSRCDRTKICYINYIYKIIHKHNFGAKGSEIELFWRGFGIILLKFCILFF